MNLSRRTFIRAATGSGMLLLTGTSSLSCDEVPSVAYEPWSGPSPSLADEDVRLRIVSYALLAPSFRNAQPWWVDLRGDGIRVRPEMHRVRETPDTDNRNSLISLGAFVETLAVAASAFGIELTVEPLPDAANNEELTDNTIVAACTLGTPQASPKDPLFDQILHRRTNRMVYDDRPLESRHVRSLQSTRMPSSVSLEIITERNDVRRISSVVHAETVRQYYDARSSELLLSHLRWTSDDVRLRRDGMTMENAGIPPPSRLWHQLRAFIGSEDKESALGLLSAAVEDQTASAAAYGYLSTPENGYVQAMETGRALTRVHLQATADGVALQPFSSVFENGSPSPELEAVLPDARRGTPHILFRLGYGPDVPPSPRRSLFEITRI